MGVRLHTSRDQVSRSILKSWDRGANLKWSILHYHRRWNAMSCVHAREPSQKPELEPNFLLSAINLAVYTTGLQILGTEMFIA